MTVYIEESEIHDVDVLAQTITHLAARLSLHDPLREPIEVLAGIIIDKTQEWQRRYEAALRDKGGMRGDESMEDAEQQSYTGQDRQEEVSASALLPPGSDLCS